jgi:inosose dehydratase
MSIRFALNPIQWSATADGWIDPALRPPLPLLLAEVRASGFDAVQSERPPHMASAGYRRLLATAGLEPAPGYFSLAFGSGSGDYLEAVRSVADEHAELDLREVFVSIRMAEERIAAPARGAHAAAGRPASIAEALNAVGELMLKHDVTPCLHPHVGSWIETEAEIEEVLDLTNPALVALGPDTGHLAWAGVDPVEFARRHKSRIRGLHLKDVRLGVAHAPELRAADYRSVVAAGLWAEPGRGDLDLLGVLETLSPDYDGWVVVEVDRPSAASPLESARVSAEWVAALPRHHTARH